MSTRMAHEEQPMREPSVLALPKVATGIEGLDTVLHGGLPAGRTTLIWGGPGCGKTVFGLEFLYRGALAGEPGILVAFEERVPMLRQNALTLGWDLTSLERLEKLLLIEGAADPSVVLAGDFDLRALLAIIGGQAQRLGARRLVLDAVDALTSLLQQPERERIELYALHHWLLEQQMTAVMTMKMSEYSAPLRRYAFLDYITDCVIQLDQRSAAQRNTRRLQVTKYRGSDFHRNEHPYVIAEGGIHFLPISSVGLVQEPLGEIVSSGNRRLDTLLGGGYKRGACLLVPGAAGTGKTILASTMAQTAAARGDKVLFLSFEESEAAILANMLSPGIDLRPAVQESLLRFHTAMPEAMGAEEHLFRVLRIMAAFQPQLVVVDALSSSLRMGSEQAAFEYAFRLLTSCKEQGITCLFTSQLNSVEEESAIGAASISSLVDTLVLLAFAERSSRLRRTLLVKKARGMAHSLQYHEFRITGQGIEILTAYDDLGAEPERPSMSSAPPEPQARQDRKPE
jgi:circadian clock protein KaiC